MMYIDFQEITMGFGGHPVIENASLQIHAGEKIALIGRNGQGKSTFLKLIYGDHTPESGEIQKKQGLTISYLAQKVPQDICGTIFDVLVQGLGKIGETIVEYNNTSQQLGQSTDDSLMDRFSKLQEKLDNEGGWEKLQQVEEIISRLELDPQEKFEHLSAGRKRRVLLGKALVNKPNLLLLDEPTNHLDIPSIQWLEDFFSRYSETILFVTHDRSFLQKIATRIIELDNGMLTSWQCNYPTFLERKEELMQAQEKQQELFDKRLAQEEVWIRKGVLARRTRNQGRVRRLKEMREQYRQRRKKVGALKMNAQLAERSGNLVILAENISFAYEEKTIIPQFSTTIMRGDRLGIIGANGCGKTTLLQILLGNLKPQQGSITHGTNLQISYFDQLRNTLDQEKSVYDNIGEGNDFLVINNEKKHVMSYLQDFLFLPKDTKNPVWTLSGGEQNRLLLAKLFLQKSNVLILDEPTNDLDIETLDLLENLLIDYPGTVFLVSHDRTFLNNVATNSIVFEDDTISEYAGGYDDWLQQRPQETKKKKEVVYEKPIRNKKSNNKKNITSKEKRELDNLPLKIEQLEEEQNKLYEITSAPSFYQKDKGHIAEIQDKLKQVDEELENCYARWEELEE